MTTNPADVTQPTTTAGHDTVQPAQPIETEQRVRQLSAELAAIRDQLSTLLDRLPVDDSGDLAVQPGSPAHRAERSRAAQAARDIQANDVERQDAARAAVLAANTRRSETLRVELSTGQASAHLAHLSPGERDHCIGEHIKTAAPAADRAAVAEWRAFAAVGADPDGCCWHCCSAGSAHGHTRGANQPVPRMPAGPRPVKQPVGGPLTSPQGARSAVAGSTPRAGRPLPR